MTYVVATVTGLISAACGWLAGGYLSPIVAEFIVASGIANFGIVFDAFDLHGVGAGLGLVAGTWLALRFQGGHRSMRAIAWRGLVSITAGGLIVGATLWLTSAMFDRLGMNARELTVDFDIRLPATTKLPENTSDIQIELHTDQNQAIAKLVSVERDGAQTILRGNVPILFRTPQRTIILSLPGETARIFKLLLSANPPANAEFSPWQAIDPRDQPVQTVRTTPASADYAIRYRAR
jgi:hypothetical protein